MQNKSSTNLLTILSLSLVLFLLGLYGIISFNSGNIINQLKEKVNIVIELQDDTSQTSLEELLEKLKSNEAVVSESIEYLSKEDAKELMIGEDNMEFYSDSLPIPFSASIVLNLEADKYNEEFLDVFSSTVRNERIVSDIFYQEELFQLLKSNISRMGFVLGLIGLLLLILAVAMIYNTVNLSMIQDQQKIETMELVGAEREYIKKPYIKWAILTGIKSLCIAVLLIVVVMIVVALNMPFVMDAISIVSNILILSFIALLATGIPFWATNRIVNRYLDKI